MSNRDSRRLPLYELTCGLKRPPGQGSQRMTQYLISFGARAMDHIPGEDMPAVAKASHAVVQDAIDAGVLVFTGGLEDQRASIVATDGTVTGGPYPEAIGGLTIVECPHARRRWSGLPGPPSPAAARKKSGTLARRRTDEMLRQADRRR